MIDAYTHHELHALRARDLRREAESERRAREAVAGRAEGSGRFLRRGRRRRGGQAPEWAEAA